MESKIEQGYIVLADLSGFTPFMEKTEIAHSVVILKGLMEQIIKRFSSLLTIAEVEGDAVFAYAQDSRITRGELLLELIETTYNDYRDRRQTMQHNATCPCRACQSIHKLDLKFVTHFGEYILHEIAGKRKPVGSSVNLSHRLLKNNVREVTGWRAYALFSESSLSAMNINPEGMRKIDVPYDTGTVKVGSIDLNERYAHLLRGRKVFLSREEADMSRSYTLDGSPPLVWDWLTDPKKRKKWVPHSDLSITQKPLGRTGPQTRYHCAASDVIEEILDWHPFKYYSVYLSKGRLKILITSELEASGGGTRVHWNMRLHSVLPRMFARPITRFFMNKGFRLDDNFELLTRIFSEFEKPDPNEEVTAPGNY